MDLATKYWPNMFGPFSATGGTYAQAGSGDPSPANIRAITAWKAAGASVAAKRCTSNRLSYAPAGTNVSAGITFESFGNGSYRIYGTASGDSTPKLTLPAAYIIPGNMYCHLRNTTSQAGAIGFYLRETLTTRLTDMSPTSANRVALLNDLTGRTVNYFTAYVAGGITIDMTLSPMVMLASSATSYELYTGQDITLSSPAELYAGYLGDDWYWRRTWAIVTLNGTQTCYFNSAGTDTARFDLNTSLPGGAATNANRVACSHFNSIYGDVSDTEHCRNPNAAGPEVFYIYINKTRMAGWDDGWSSAQKQAALNTWLAGQVTAETPVQVAYQLATPVLYAPIIP